MYKGRPRIGKELKKPSDYTYDYPENRKLGAKLVSGDISFIAANTGHSISYVHAVLREGTRNNDKIIAFARKVVAMREILLASN